MVINGIVQNYDYSIFNGEEKILTVDIIDDDSSEDTNGDGTDDMAGVIGDVIGEKNLRLLDQMRGLHKTSTKSLMIMPRGFTD